MIEIRLFATLRDGRDKIIKLDSNSISLAGDVLKHLSISPENVAIYLINGKHSNLDAPIKDGDVIAIFPPIGGG
ncbi:MAG TPA: MoaD/ThiS family protein [Sedimentibacter sp.]|jgi:molybdopterin converting factor small subunit|nr:MoaD/ThiS family protein [Sedimentibacter sp.]HQC71037.1 MoaD/ThiS family protein [Sedimentibacter sp.]